MKGRSLFGLMVSLAILGAVSISAFAQSQRYPTDAEVQRLRGNLREQFQAYQRVYGSSNRRTSAEIKSLESFVSAWSKVDPSVAPFIGEWNRQENWLSIFPSKVRSQVCVIYVPGDEPEASFSLGSVSNDQIRVRGGLLDREVIIKQDNYLGLVGVYQNQVQVFVQAFPKLLKPPTNSSLHGRKASRVIQQFNAAGCTASLPARR